MMGTTKTAFVVALMCVMCLSPLAFDDIDADESLRMSDNYLYKATVVLEPGEDIWTMGSYFVTKEGSPNDQLMDRYLQDPTDTSTLRSVASASGFSTVSGMLGADAALDGAGIAWVHSRTVNGKTRVSSQRLIVDNDLLEEYGTAQMLSVATNSYGGSTEIFIRPDGTSGGGVTVEEGTGGTGPNEGEEGSFG